MIFDMLTDISYGSHKIHAVFSLLPNVKIDFKNKIYQSVWYPICTTALSTAFQCLLP